MTFGLVRGLVTIGAGVAAATLAGNPVARAEAGPQTPKARAAELLARGRSAIGPIESLKSLSAIGTRKSLLGTSGGAPESYELHFVLPDRFVQLVKTVSRSNELRTYVFGFSGSTPLNGVRSAEPMLYNARETDPTLEQRLFARLLLGWLLVTPSYLNVDFSFVGEAEAQDGRKAFVIEATGDKDFGVRLFLDQATCRPLMLTYKAVAAGSAVRAASGAKPSDGSSRKMTGAIETAAGDSNAAMYFSDVRRTGPLQLAHAFIDSRDGRTVQETQFSKLTINPEIKPALFTQP